PNAEIHCFEPYPPAADKLGALMGDRVTLHRTALGAKDGTQRLNVASENDSSSLLHMSEIQKSHFGMDEVAEIEVPIKRLDTLFPNAVPPRTLIKVDVQGYELEVLEGAGKLMAQITAVYVEISYIELYLGQASAVDIYKLLTAHGLRKQSTWNLHTGNDERIQADELYMTENMDHRQKNVPVSYDTPTIR
ncbi:MAG TPA: FkbM family methyltransferase, partial [Elainellaceae cyanobacterium]